MFLLAKLIFGFLALGLEICEHGKRKPLQQKKRRLATERKQRWRARQSQETVNRTREEDAARQANRNKQESMDMTQARRASSSLYLAIRQVTDFFFRKNRFSFDKKS
jgi:hypothetical protein